MDFARQNIRRLMGGRSINQLAEEAEIGQTWLQRYLNPDKPSGIQKANQEKLAPIARVLGVSLNDLMFRDLSETTPRSTSQPAQLDPGKVTTVARALRILIQRRNPEMTLDLEDPIDAELFCLAYAELMKMDESDGLAAGAVIADLMAAREERRNAGGKGDNGQQAGGAAGGKARRSVAR